MLKLDHLTVIAPTLAKGAAHVRDCLDLDVPFGTRHTYMGTHNHRLQLGDDVYLEIVASDPDGTPPDRARWFGLDNQDQVCADWEDGRRLRGWVASTDAIASVVSAHGGIYGGVAALPPNDPEFLFTIPADGSLPLDGAAPSLIDHRGQPTAMSDIPDMGARLQSFAVECKQPARVETLYRALSIDRPPTVKSGVDLRYSAQIETPTGPKVLT